MSCPRVGLHHNWILYTDGPVSGPHITTFFFPEPTLVYHHWNVMCITFQPVWTRALRGVAFFTFYESDLSWTQMTFKFIKHIIACMQIKSHLSRNFSQIEGKINNTAAIQTLWQKWKNFVKIARLYHDIWYQIYLSCKLSIQLLWPCVEKKM